MSEELNMPQMGYDMKEGVVVKWLMEEGSAVKIGDPVAEIETDKAVVEFESYAEGTLEKILVEEGSKVNVGEPIAIVGDGSNITEEEIVEEPAIEEEVTVESEEEIVEEPIIEEEVTVQLEEEIVEESVTEESSADQKIKASPLAKTLANDNNIDLSNVTGTGPGGRIVKSDVLALIDNVETTEKIKIDLTTETNNAEPQIRNSDTSVKEENKIERHLITLEDPKSPISEAYRTLRTSIMYSDTNTNKTILVSSPGPGEGKTTTVANLALTYANLGKKTLLIDTDLRKPVINKVFSVEKNPGLTNYLINDEKFEVVIKETDIENLHIIPSGIVPPNPSELLDSDSMKTMIDNLKEQYDIILFDTPPIVAVTDALILSKHIDKFILVCRPGVTQKGALERVLKNLDQVNSKINGCVFNAIGDLDSYGSAYYYNDYQYYYKNS